MGEWYTLAAVTLLTCVVLALALEGVWRAVRTLRRGSSDPHTSVSYYAASAWGRQYWREFDRGMQYVPYTLWRRRPISGTYVRVDTFGIRRTPGADCRPGAYTVYAFGGSTMWGTGAPDDATIPAILQREIASRMQRPVCVVNLGESAYVSTQEVIDLMLRLQRGGRPDLVLFYDGINDAFVAYQSGRAGVHQNVDQFHVRFDGSVPMRMHLWFNTHSRAYRSINARLTRRPTRGAGAELEQLTREASSVYLTNYGLVEALSRQYGFEYVFFLQPVSFFAPKRLNPEEQRMVDDHARRLGHAAAYFSAFVKQVEEDAGGLSNFQSLTRVLEGVDGFVWADWAHMTPEGNRRVALAMMPAVERRLPDTAAAGIRR